MLGEFVLEYSRSFHESHESEGFYSSYSFLVWFVDMATLAELSKIQKRQAKTSKCRRTRRLNSSLLNPSEFLPLLNVFSSTNLSERIWKIAHHHLGHMSSARSCPLLLLEFSHFPSIFYHLHINFGLVSACIMMEAHLPDMVEANPNSHVCSVQTPRTLRSCCKSQMSHPDSYGSSLFASLWVLEALVWPVSRSWLGMEAQLFFERSCKPEIRCSSLIVLSVGVNRIHAMNITALVHSFPLLVHLLLHLKILLCFFFTSSIWLLVQETLDCTYWMNIYICLPSVLY